jgi:hypothetical protein
MANDNLTSAKKAKNDEFYTQYEDIEKEMNAYLEYDKDTFKDAVVLLPCDDPEWSNFTKYFAQNFKRLGLKKLISTSYAPNSKPEGLDYQPALFEIDSPNFDEVKTRANGKIFTLTKDINGDGEVDFHDFEWEYLEGDGDFRSEEVTALLEEATHVITNPPFSLFREFIAWIMKAKKKFLIIGNMNAITYKEVFPLIKENKVWLGNNAKVNGGAMLYEIPESIANLDQVRDILTDEKGNKKYITRVQGVRWFTNIDHGRRHEPLQLMTEADNIKFSKNKDVKGVGYKKYDNYDAIEVSLVVSIPSDYKGVMGVPISFLDKYNPDQFEILGLGIANLGLSIGVKPYKPEHKKYRKEVQKRGAVDGDLYMIINGEVTVPYARVLIKHKKKKDK